MTVDWIYRHYWYRNRINLNLPNSCTKVHCKGPPPVTILRQYCLLKLYYKVKVNKRDLLKSGHFNTSTQHCISSQPKLWEAPKSFKIEFQANVPSPKIFKGIFTTERRSYLTVLWVVLLCRTTNNRCSQIIQRKDGLQAPSDVSSKQRQIGPNTAWRPLGDLLTHGHTTRELIPRTDGLQNTLPLLLGAHTDVNLQIKKPGSVRLYSRQFQGFSLSKRLIIKVENSFGYFGKVLVTLTTGFKSH